MTSSDFPLKDALRSPADRAAPATEGATELASGVAASTRRLPVECGDIDMRIARDGTWFYHGSPIGRKPLVQLFAKVLRRQADGSFYLVTPAERARITVEDAPFVAVELDVEGAGRTQALTFRTNVEDRVTADVLHPIRVVLDPATGEPSPYVLVRDGLEARINRAVFYQMVELGVEDQVDGTPYYGVWSRNVFFPIGPAEHPE